MNHDYIIESNLIDQYVLGTLAADQIEEFEAHFVDCPECVDQLNISRSFIHDLKGLAAQETLFSDHTRTPRTRRWQLQQLVPLRFWPAIACGCVIVALGVAFFAVRRLGRLEAELRQAKEDAAAMSLLAHRKNNTMKPNRNWLGGLMSSSGNSKRKALPLASNLQFADQNLRKLTFRFMP
jgi:anti-sigma factor RsiW